MMPIRRSAKKNDSTARTPKTLQQQDLDNSQSSGAAHSRLEAKAEHEPVVVPSRGGNLLSLYFSRSFKRRERLGSEARKAAYQKGDLSSRREPEFGLFDAPSPQPARPPAFAEALRNLRED